MNDVKPAFDAIGFAALILDSFDYTDLRESMRRQLDRAYYVDPTLALRVHADKEWDAKMRLLDAAAAFQHGIRAERAAAHVSEEPSP